MNKQTSIKALSKLV